MKTHTISLQGKRNYNEDRFDIQLQTYAIYDGHGGSAISEKLKNDFLFGLKNIYHRSDICNFFKDYQSNLKLNHFSEGAECGSTVLISRINVNEQTIQVISLGDSRGIICYGNKLHS